MSTLYETDIVAWVEELSNCLARQPLERHDCGAAPRHCPKTQECY